MSRPAPKPAANLVLPHRASTGTGRGKGMNGRPLSILAAVLFLGPLLLVAVPEADAAPTQRVLEITQSKTHPSQSWSRWEASTVKLFDFDGDGDQEIIAQNSNGWVYVFDSKSGKLLAELHAPGYSGVDNLNGPEAAVTDHGGRKRIIVASSSGIVYSFLYNGLGSDGRFNFFKEWQRNACRSGSSMDAPPVLGDLDRDGRLEIVAATEEDGLHVFRIDGSTLWKSCSLGGGNAGPVIEDINFDGWPEVVYVNDGGLVAVFDGRNGAWKWGFNIRDRFNIGAGSIPVSAGVGQLDGQGGLDIVAGARDTHAGSDYDRNNAILVALDHRGNLLWSFQDKERGNPLTYTRPVIGDANGDGRNEVYWGDWNTVGHKGGVPAQDSWKVTGPANFYRLDNWGNMVWRTSLSTYWSNKDVPVADVDGDGRQEMLANGPNGGQDGIWYLNTDNGGKETWVSVHPWKAKRAPIVGDIWGHGTTQWVIQVEPAVSWADGHAILLFDTQSPYNALWPHKPGPWRASGETQPPPDDGPSGDGSDWSATFKTTAQNAWWQELYVEPDTPRQVVSAHVRIDGGTWMPMEKSSWGAWTSSYHTPSGTKVQFLARDGSGGESVSGTFTWLDGTTEKRSTDSPSSGDGGGDGDGSFAATFKTKAQNEWWQEVYVQPDHATTIQQVYVQINDGPWRTMEARSWGAWTTSYHAPAGSKVEFIAKNDMGDWSQSQPFTWLDGTNERRSVPAGQESPPGSGGDGGDGGDTSVSFRLSDNVNNWWVEVYIDSSASISAVEAKVEGSGTKALDKKDWGSWAKSFHVASGSKVSFVAHLGDGSTKTSQTYTWP